MKISPKPKISKFLPHHFSPINTRVYGLEKRHPTNQIIKQKLNNQSKLIKRNQRSYDLTTTKVVGKQSSLRSNLAQKEVQKTKKKLRFPSQSR